MFLDLNWPFRFERAHFKPLKQKMFFLTSKKIVIACTTEEPTVPAKNSNLDGDLK